jgi:hypothetical protein
MNVTSIRPQSAAERHVQFSEFVEVRYIEPTETAPVQPSLHAQRLERELRNRPCVKTQTQAQPTQSKPLKVYKNVLHTVAMVCGALIIPSFTCLLLGPIGLVAPAVLASLALTCVLLAGRPTESMERKRAERAAVMSEYDPR